MIKTLRDAELTLNFESDVYWRHLLTNSWRNYYQVNPLTIEDSYIVSRDNAEERLFNYSSAGMDLIPQGVTDRIRSFGSLDSGNNLSFTPSIRPKYAALNYAKDRYGPANHYGNSYFVLKEHVKHNCTFTDRDSFHVTDEQGHPENHVANYHNLHRLIIHMSSDKLKKLDEVSHGNYSASGIPDGYIEAQIHGDVVVIRDVEKMCIDYFELRSGEDYHHGIVEMYYKIFAEKSNIQLIFT
ncbi:DUF3626 domain-containing protein [Pedobacter hartonius]|nr:DUF3626 domain-containing protein [Pedobacter hartonius]